MVKKKPDKKSVKASVETNTKVNKKSGKKVKKINPKIFESYEDENRAEWNKKRGEFEEIADELSRDNDFIVLRENSLREKWVKRNFPKQKDVKALTERAMELYRMRIKKFSI